MPAAPRIPVAAAPALAPCCHPVLDACGAILRQAKRRAAQMCNPTRFAQPHPVPPCQPARASKSAKGAGEKRALRSLGLGVVGRMFPAAPRMPFTAALIGSQYGFWLPRDAATPRAPVLDTRGAVPTFEAGEEARTHVCNPTCMWSDNSNSQSVLAFIGSHMYTPTNLRKQRYVY